MGKLFVHTASRVRAVVDLMRLPNVFTAWADVLAGFFFAGGKADEWFVLVRLMAASGCLYAGGVALNDVVDFEIDREQRPGRPIPSGRIGISTARRLSLALLAGGVVIASTISLQSFLVATTICTLILLYNVVKESWLSVPLMGLCRAFNLLLGMHGLTGVMPLSAARPMGIMFAYVASLTFYARRETLGGHRLRLGLGTAGVAASVAATWALREFVANVRYPEYGLLSAALLILVAGVGIRAAVRPEPAVIQRSVKIFILGIVVLDASLAWAVAGWPAALMVLLLLIPAIFVSRWARIT